MTEETLSKGKKKKKNPKNPTKPKTSLHRPLQALLPLAPRSGRLRGPRPQSPFDPLLGSEPCDPVGRQQLSGVPYSLTFSCWTTEAAPTCVGDMADTPRDAMLKQTPTP
jgi:hypothetical protein